MTGPDPSAAPPPPPPTLPAPVGRRRAGLLGALVGAAILAGLMLTEPTMAIVWDEPYTLGQKERIHHWLRALADPPGYARRFQPIDPLLDLAVPDGIPAPRPDEIDTRAKLFGPRVMDWFWPFAIEQPNGHPPFYAIVGLIGDVLTPWRGSLPRARLGAMLAFALAGGSLFAFAARRWGMAAAVAAAGAWVLQPRPFAHAHYALLDSLLQSLWMGAILCFALAVERPEGGPARPRWGWVIGFGALVGCALATKLTGWFLPLPFIAWTLLYRDRRGMWALGVGGLIAVLTLVALIPPWWADPIHGLTRFLRANLTRGNTTLIPTLFLGRVYYTPQGSLPWYNTLVWTVFVTPVGFLALAALGAVRCLRHARSERVGMLALGHCAFLLTLRALPHTPGHDAERQFLAAFGVMALPIGYAAAGLVARWGRWGGALIAASLAEGAVGIAMMMPVPLSYYSPAVGGLPGAARWGMEPTYFWDALTPEALGWLNRNTATGERVMFSAQITLLNYLRASGQLRVPCRIWEPGQTRWVVVQARAGMYGDVDRALIRRSGPENVLVARQGVPLIYVFPFQEYVTEQWRVKREAAARSGDSDRAATPPSGP